MSGVSTVNSLEFHRNITDHKNKKNQASKQPCTSNLAEGARLGHGTIVVLGVDGEAELLNEELADLGCIISSSNSEMLWTTNFLNLLGR
jgi:hypothetical protein